jgi:hypothetical protein
MIKIRWTWWPNISTDNSVPEDIGQSLHRHKRVVRAVAESCWNQPQSPSSSVNSEKNYPYISFTINCFVKKQVQQSFLHLKHTTPQLSLDGAGLHGLYVDSMNSNSDYVAYLYIPASETTLHQKRMSTADRSQLQRQTVETNCKSEPC